MEGVRKLVARRYPYLIYYSVDVSADEIAIIAIQHSSREREFFDS
jgi:toxin ParE1/3/4